MLVFMMMVLLLNDVGIVFLFVVSCDSSFMYSVNVLVLYVGVS